VSYTTRWSTTLSSKQSTCLTQLTLGSYVVQSWSRNTPKNSPSETLVLHRVGRALLRTPSPHSAPTAKCNISVQTSPFLETRETSPFFELASARWRPNLDTSTSRTTRSSSSSLTSHLLESDQLTSYAPIAVRPRREPGSLPDKKVPTRNPKQRIPDSNWVLQHSSIL